MKKIIALAAVLTLLALPALAELPTPVGSQNLSGTIAVTNTFQEIQPQTNNRFGCTIQNGSASNSQWVYFGTCASATKAKSAQLTPGQALNCSSPGTNVVLKDRICITGTATEAFYANFQ